MYEALNYDDLSKVKFRTTLQQVRNDKSLNTKSCLPRDGISVLERKCQSTTRFWSNQSTFYYGRFTFPFL